MKNNHIITIPYITGDWIWQDLMPHSQAVLQAAWQKEYWKWSKIVYKELLAWQEAFLKTWNWLPQETIDILKRYAMKLKWPTATLNDRSVNVALRYEEDLYANIRTSNYIDWVPSPLIAPWRKNNQVTFRETVEDVYVDPWFYANQESTKQLIHILNTQFGYSLDEIDTAIGIKPISKKKSERLIRSGAEWAKKYGCNLLTLVHKWNIQKATEWYFKNLWYQLIQNEYGDDFITQKQRWALENHLAKKSLEENAFSIDRDRFPILNEQQRRDAINEVKAIIEKYGSTNWEDKKVVNDIIADNALQQATLNHDKFEVIVTTNLNWDYLSDALAAWVWWLWFMWWANHNPETMMTIAEPAHWTWPDLERNIANPISMLESIAITLTLHWYDEVAYRIRKGYQDQILTRRVTKDLCNTANKNYTRVLKQKKASPDTLGIDLLLQYTKLINDSYTPLWTQQFAEEIIQKVHLQK